MEINIIELQEITIIGKEGFCTSEKNVVGDLWKDANSHFAEVASIGKKNEDGTYVGFWGAMSDESRSFKPWTENFSRGFYLAGIEANDDVVVPSGWTKWNIPARKYIVVDVENGKYNEIFFEVINCIIPEKGWQLVGAVCDYTEPATGKNKMYFPIDFPIEVL